VSIQFPVQGNVKAVNAFFYFSRTKAADRVDQLLCPVKGGILFSDHYNSAFQ